MISLSCTSAVTSHAIPRFTAGSITRTKILREAPILQTALANQPYWLLQGIYQSSTIWEGLTKTAYEACLATPLQTLMTQLSISQLLLGLGIP